MWARGFWGGSYWGENYWPEGDGGGIPPVAGDLTPRGRPRPWRRRR